VNDKRHARKQEGPAEAKEECITPWTDTPKSIPEAEWAGMKKAVGR